MVKQFLRDFLCSSSFIVHLQWVKHFVYHVLSPAWDSVNIRIDECKHPWETCANNRNPFTAPRWVSQKGNPPNPQHKRVSMCVLETGFWVPKFGKTRSQICWSIISDNTKYWLFNRDPYNALLNYIPIKLGSIFPIFPKQPLSCFFSLLCGGWMHRFHV